MNETPPDKQTSSHAHPDTSTAAVEPVAAAKVKAGTVLSVILIIIALLASGTALYLTYRDRNVAVSAHTTLENLVETTEMLGARLEELEDQLEQLREAQDVTSRALLDLAGNQPGSNEDWALAEVEFLLILATHHIQLEHDPAAALAAMRTADLRLRGLDNPALDPVRVQLARDSSRLQEVSSTDTRALALLLADLASRVDTLPLAGDAGLKEETVQEPGEAQAAAPEGILHTIWRELRNLVIIRHETSERRPVLLPDQKYFVYQSLRLELEGARLSLLRRDTENLHAAAAYAQKLLDDHFAAGDPAVQKVIASLQQLSSINLEPDLPDISSTLESLRAYMRQQATEIPPVEKTRPGPDS